MPYVKCLDLLNGIFFYAIQFICTENIYILKVSIGSIIYEMSFWDPSITAVKCLLIYIMSVTFVLLCVSGFYFHYYYFFIFKIELKGLRV